MERLPCTVCQKKTTRTCGLCEEASCQKCAHSLGSDYFSLLGDIPEDLTQGYYCHSCFQKSVAETYEQYETLREQAQAVEVFYKKKHSREVVFFKKSKEKLAVKDCADEQEVLLRLAFLTVKSGFDTLIQVETQSHKTHNGSYKKILWSGTGVAARK